MRRPEYRIPADAAKTMNAVIARGDQWAYSECLAAGDGQNENYECGILPHWHFCSTQQEVIVSEELKNPSSKVLFFRLLPDSRK